MSVGNINSNELFDKLAKKLDKSNNIFYLAVKPELFENIAHGLKKYDLHENSRVIVEKPLGWDLGTAGKINKAILSAFEEDNIYRIDHYLGKEMTRNITVLRFANEIFEPLLCSRYIENIQISICEDIGVLDRGRYYDKAGAIRDMLQNHMMQLLCLATMEMPASMSPDDIARAKISVINDLKIPESKNIIIGQYNGYLNEEGVSPDSITETYAALKTSIDNDRWKGTDIYLRTGKMLSRRYAQIVYEFRKPEKRIFKNADRSNLLALMIQPSEGVSVKFNLKSPGSETDINYAKMNYCQTCIYGENSPEAYEKLIFDSIKGDRSSFTSWQEVEASWRYIDEIQKTVDLNRNNFLKKYDKGTTGPRESVDLHDKGKVWIGDLND
jgi:glucose-6-phosphate 1-dehydrogenase